MALSLISVRILSNSYHCGRALTSLSLPESCIVLGIVRNNQVIQASAEPIIWYGDYILAVALNSASVPMLSFVLNKKHPIHYSPKECFIKNSTI
ncbi:TrkA C-terminal domain-containing protein [Nostocaceae cyanobacterium CENA357]|uniref:TrkA C-terminal domain-containing protein n=1 Tax=Atlanticothrix silvestris CENA357 TaxID=1725252 RepID=A0A8J7HHT4_9CYAN|nr:TrkA C-terminal domain-containing protein [Atlanticothrix silvestris]MBH8553350.1 TrkA C-terminal domain-containing protein [Atlanticothrix silvestris CENA357]